MPGSIASRHRSAIRWAPLAAIQIDIHLTKSDGTLGAELVKILVISGDSVVVCPCSVRVRACTAARQLMPLFMNRGRSAPPAAPSCPPAAPDTTPPKKAAFRPSQVSHLHDHFRLHP